MSTITRGQHPFFAKDFVYTRPKETEKFSLERHVIKNPEFFAGLPTKQTAKRSKLRASLLISEKENNQRRLSRLEAHISKLQKQLTTQKLICADMGPLDFQTQIPDAYR